MEYGIISAMDFKKFIEALGKALGMRLENAGGACGLDVDDVTVILHDADDLVLLTAQIGPPPPEEGLETLFSTVLKANWLYRGTGAAADISPDDKWQEGADMKLLHHSYFTNGVRPSGPACAPGAHR